MKTAMRTAIAPARNNISTNSALIAALTLCIVAAASGSAEAQVRIPGFRPSTSGFSFSNSFPVVPHFTLNVLGVQVPIGNAANGLCGGMAFAARDYFEAGLARPALTTPPSSGPLYNTFVGRLYDSFNLPNGPVKYMHLMNPDLPDHETWWSMTFGSPRGRAWITIVEEWPRIKADLDGGHPSPIALIHVKSHDPMAMGQNHQVLAWGYDLVGNDLTIFVYDPNYPDNDNIRISLNIGNPTVTTAMSYSSGRPLWAFFRPDYIAQRPFNLSDGMIIRELSAAPVYAIVGGAKLGIRTPAELLSFFGGWGAVNLVADGVAASIGDVPRDGTVVRETDQPEVKVLDGGRDRWITSPSVLARFGGWGVVRLVPSQSLAAIPDGPPVY
jgi:hypothetical protein